MSFFNELKRRSVVKVAVVYAITGWVVAQIADLAAENFAAPDWVMQMFMVFLVLGFPIALVLAWAFEMTPEGLRSQSQIDQKSESATSSTAALILLPTAGLILGVVLFVFFRPWSGSGEEAADAGAAGSTDAGAEIAADSDGTKTVAVLPFENFSGAQEDEYFSDGLADTVLHRLAQLHGLKVIARNSSFQYKGRNEDVRVIGQALGADAVLEGSVQRYGDQLRVIAQLIDTSDASHIWSQTYDRAFEDIFAIHDDIAASVVDAMQVSLLEGDAARLQQRGTNNPEAYELFLKAKQQLTEQQWGRRSVEESMPLLQRAIELDPEYAEAWAELASNYSALAFTDVMAEDFREHVRLGEEAAQRALAFDSGSGIGHFAMGEILRRGGEGERAFEHFTQAVELNPNHADSWQQMGLTLIAHPGRAEEAFEYLSRAAELDMRSPWLQRQLAFALDGLGRFEDEHRTLSEAMKEYPIPIFPLDLGAFELNVNGRPDKALQMYFKTIEMDPEFTDFGTSALHKPVLAYVAAGAFGQAEMWQHNVESRSQGFNTLLSVFIDSHKGEHAAAQATLERDPPSTDAPPPVNILAGLAIADICLLAGDNDCARRRYRELIGDLDGMDDFWANMPGGPAPAVKFAYTLQKAGDNETARTLLEEVLEVIADRSRFGAMTILWMNAYGYLYADAEALALLGRHDEALDALESVLTLPDDGYLSHGSLPVFIEESPLLESLYDEQRFQAFAEEMKRRRAVMRERMALVEAPKLAEPPAETAAP